MSAQTSSFTGDLRESSDQLWEQLTAHPFVHEMAAGTLPLEKFQHYIEQNLLYLPQYSRALALGAAKSRDDDELRSFAARSPTSSTSRSPRTSCCASGCAG